MDARSSASDADVSQQDGVQDEAGLFWNRGVWRRIRTATPRAEASQHDGAQADVVPFPIPGRRHPLRTVVGDADVTQHDSAQVDIGPFRSRGGRHRVRTAMGDADVSQHDDARVHAGPYKSLGRRHRLRTDTGDADGSQTGGAQVDAPQHDDAQVNVGPFQSHGGRHRLGTATGDADGSQHDGDADVSQHAETQVDISQRGGRQAHTVPRSTEYAFVVSNKWGSARMRGDLVVEAFGRNPQLGTAELIACTSGRSLRQHRGTLNTRAAVVVHVKFPCKEALKLFPLATHVWDVIDTDEEWWSDNAESRWEVKQIRKNIIVSSVAAEASCLPMQRCVRIPHLFNLGCNAHDPQGFLNGSLRDATNLTLLVMGTAEQVSTNGVNIVFQAKEIYEQSGQSKWPFRVVAEYSSEMTCEKWTSKVAVAIAWNKVGTRWWDAPSTRFQNAAMLNIPVIGSSAMDSFHDFDGAEPFLCKDAACVAEKLRALREGKLLDEWKRCRAGVASSLSEAAVLQKYAMFRDPAQGQVIELPGK